MNEERLVAFPIDVGGCSELLATRVCGRPFDVARFREVRLSAGCLSADSARRDGSACPRAVLRFEASYDRTNWATAEDGEYGIGRDETLDVRLVVCEPWLRVCLDILLAPVQVWIAREALGVLR